MSSYYDSEKEDYCYKFEIPVILKVNNTVPLVIDLLEKYEVDNLDNIFKDLKKLNIDNSFVHDFKQYVLNKHQKENLDLQTIFDEYVTENYKSPLSFDKDHGGTYNFSDVDYVENIQDYIEEKFEDENFIDYFDYFDLNSIRIIDFKDSSIVVEFCTSFELDDEQITECKIFLEEQCKGEWGKSLLNEIVNGCKIHMWWEKGEIRKKYSIGYLGMTGPSEEGDEDLRDYYDDDERY